MQRRVVTPPRPPLNPVTHWVVTCTSTRRCGHTCHRLCPPSALPTRACGRSCSCVPARCCRRCRRVRPDAPLLCQRLSRAVVVSCVTTYVTLRSIRFVGGPPLHVLLAASQDVLATGRLSAGVSVVRHVMRHVLFGVRDCVASSHRLLAGSVHVLLWCTMIRSCHWRRRSPYKPVTAS